MADSKVKVPGGPVTRWHAKIWWKSWGLGFQIDFDRHWGIAILIGPLDIQIYRDWEFDL